VFAKYLSIALGLRFEALELVNPRLELTGELLVFLLILETCLLRIVLLLLTRTLQSLLDNPFNVLVRVLEG
jgi:hypothetical protein